MRQECNRHVAVYFSPEEKAEYARQLSRNCQDLETLEDRKKQVASEFKAKIDAANAEIFKVARLLNNGYEYRDVKCDVQMDVPRPGLKRVIRMDTGEVVEECPMTADELQRRLEFQDEQQIEQVAAEIAQESPAEAPTPEPEPEPEPVDAQAPALEEMPVPLSDPVRLTGSGEGWSAEIIILETQAGFESEASLQIGSKDPIAVDGGVICSAESEAREDGAKRLYSAAQKYYAEAHGYQKRVIRDLMAWASEFLPKKSKGTSVGE